MRKSILGATCLVLASMLTLPGCSHSKVTITDRSDPYRNIDLTEPDFIQVDRFAVTPDEVRMMSALGGVTGTDVDQKDKELTIGNAFSAALQSALIAELERDGIRAYARENAPRGTWKTGIISGYFYNNAQLGFALRDSQFDARTVFNIREVEIGDITMDIQTKLHTNMMNSEWERVVDREAKMVAKEIVDKIVVPAYKRRGWSVKVTR